MDKIAIKISELKSTNGTLYFNKIDLKYAYRQLPLHPETQKHCKFTKLGGKATGTYQFLYGSYGLTDLPAKFQTMMDTTLDGLNSANAFLDDIIIISKGTLEQHKREIDKTLKGVDDENLTLSLHKCESGLTETVWLQYKNNSEGITPTKKTDAIIQLDNPRILKQLRSIMGSIHQLIKSISNLATLSAPLQPLLTKSTVKTPKKWNGKKNRQLHSIKLNKQYK